MIKQYLSTTTAHYRCRGCITESPRCFSLLETFLILMKDWRCHRSGYENLLGKDSVRRGIKSRIPMYREILMQTQENLVRIAVSVMPKKTVIFCNTIYIFWFLSYLNYSDNYLVDHSEYAILFKVYCSSYYLSTSTFWPCTATCFQNFWYFYLRFFISRFDFARFRLSTGVLYPSDEWSRSLLYHHTQAASFP